MIDVLNGPVSSLNVGDFDVSDGTRLAKGIGMLDGLTITN